MVFSGGNSVNFNSHNTMTKKEFLAMSLPYELSVQYLSFEGYEYPKVEPNFTGKFEGAPKLSKKEIGVVRGVLENMVTYGNNEGSCIKDIKPILRPLSDLTKPIEHKGEKFVPMERLITRSIPIKIDNLNYISLDEIYSSYTETTLNDWLTAISYLLEWHFDIADLISKGEAIDVNTLETNPYK